MNALIEAELDNVALQLTREAMLEEIMVLFYGWIVL